MTIQFLINIVTLTFILPIPYIRIHVRTLRDIVIVMLITVLLDSRCIPTPRTYQMQLDLVKEEMQLIFVR